MVRKNNFLGIFFVLLLLSIAIIKFGFPGSILEKITAPMQRISFDIFTNTDAPKLKEENLALNKKIIDQQKLVEENNALKDQFQTTNPKSQNLMPAKIIGAPNFIPGLSSVEYFILDKGREDGVKMGQAVVFKDNLLGKIVNVSQNASKAILLTNAKSSFTAKTQEGILGIVRGAGNGEIIMDNILLSDSVKTGDVVLTKGDMETDQTGMVSGLIVGKIVSVEKKPSSLFQSANLKTLIDFSNLSTVFIITGY